MLLSNQLLVLLLLQYLERNKFERIHRSTNMMKHCEAYYEASYIMMRLNPHRDAMMRCFDFDAIMKHAQWS